MAERQYRLRAAAPGLAIGHLHRLGKIQAGEQGSIGSPLEEERKLTEALESALTELQSLASSDDDLGGDILEFQIEMLGDPALLEPSAEALESGASALSAWNDCIGPQIEAFAGDDDEYFKAREADLKDLRDRVSAALVGAGKHTEDVPDQAIVLADDLTPSRFLAIDWTRARALVLTDGSPTSHVAILARARGVPALIGVSDGCQDDEPAIVDADAGLLVVDPGPSTLSDYQNKIKHEAALSASIESAPARTLSGERVQVLVNVDDPSAIDDHLLQAGDGVGLMRTEFLFFGRDRLPIEDEQYQIYYDLLHRLAGKPLVVRTLDVGGDKPLPSVTLEREANPQLGLRGLRLCLERPELMRPQARALLRAATQGQLKVMFPMVAVPEEFQQARQLFETWRQELIAEAVAAELPPLGIMVETPAAALTLDLFDADFYSIGSNDLAQYVMAAARDAGGTVGALNHPLQPAVLRLISETVRQGNEQGTEISLCGDMGSDPAAIRELLTLGLRRLSVAPAQLSRVKREICSFDG